MACCTRALRALGLGLVLALAGGSLAHANEEVHLLFMASTGTQRSALVAALERFERENPGTRVVQHFDSQEEYKRNFESRIATRPIDLAFWFAGERMRQLAAKGLIQPLDTVFAAGPHMAPFTRASLASTRIAGRSYGVPLSYYAWGFFYSKSLFQELRLTPPRTWEEFLSLCAALQARGVAPTAVGAKAGWPAAAWFDYLNLRLHGLEFHQRLLRGDIGFHDPRVRAVFVQWRTLLSKGYFFPETLDQDWDGVLPYLYRRQVGMVLMGGFAAAKFPDSELGGRNVGADIGFFPFPSLNPKVGAFEDAPLDVLVLPATGKNPGPTRKLLRYLASPDVLNAYNQSIRQLSPQRDTPLNDDPFLGAGKALLDNADGIAFFFDRDARESLVAPGFQAFTQFLQPPHDIDAAITTLRKGAAP